MLNPKSDPDHRYLKLLWAISRGLKVHRGAWSLPSGLALLSFCSLAPWAPPSLRPFSPLCSAQSFQGSALLADQGLSGLRSVKVSFKSLAYSLPSFWNYPPSLLWKKKNFFLQKPCLLRFGRINTPLATMWTVQRYIEFTYIYTHLSQEPVNFPASEILFKLSESQNC